MREKSVWSWCAINVWAYQLHLMLQLPKLPRTLGESVKENLTTYKLLMIKYLCYQTVDTRHALAPEVYLMSHHCQYR